MTESVHDTPSAIAGSQSCVGRGGGVALDLVGVTKSYGDVHALRGVDLRIPPGRITALLGENGAGKTTLMSLVAGLQRPDAGRIAVTGHDVADAPGAARRALGFAPQELGVYPTLTVRQNLMFCAELAGLRRGAARDRTAETAEPLALTELLDRRAGELSGGQQRRLHVAMALVHRPAVLLLDEATAGVDVRTRTALLDLVRGLAADGVAVCYSTHYLAEVESLDAHVAVLDGGRVIAHDTLSALVDRHARGALELTFHGPVPEDLDLPWPTRPTEDGLRVLADRPHEAAARLLELLGPTSALSGLRVVRPDLEAVFLELTGRRYRDEGSPADA
ncbi:ABC transporter ATP-binding protein [Streptomyces griseoloalbus]|uniref:ABC transporter ATP-binding protein n=1 Tax=Streptomyces griseoloalbus TaxID=67303 RepID=UPI0019B9ED06|nr:ABC transporter ATP-binding protein [Streptomyces griseoloalbus]